MTDHSVDGYLRRLSTKELELFLWQCMQHHQWDSYDYVIPQAIEILQERGCSVPKPILDAWDLYRLNPESLSPWM